MLRRFHTSSIHRRVVAVIARTSMRYTATLSSSPSPPNFEDALRTFHPGLSISHLRPHAELLRVPPWTLCDLLTDRHIKLTNKGCTELLVWTREYMRDCDDPSEITKYLVKVRAMWSTLRHRHDVRRQAFHALLDVYSFYGDVHNIKEFYRHNKELHEKEGGVHEMKVDSLPQYLQWPNPYLAISLLRALQGYSDRSRYTDILDEVIGDVGRYEQQFALHGGLVTELIKTLRLYGDHDSARQWCVWFRDHIHNVEPVPELLSWFGEVWKDKHQHGDRVAIHLAESGEEILRLMKSRPHPWPASLFRIGMHQLRVISKPMSSQLNNVALLMHEWTHHSERALEPIDYEVLTKVLCDDCAVTSVEGMWSQIVNITPVTLAEILCCLGLQESTRQQVFAKLKEMEVTKGNDVVDGVAVYQHILRRYQEHRKGSTITESLDYLVNTLVKDYIIAQNAINERQMSVVKPVLTDDNLVHVLYECVDACRDGNEAAQLLSWVCEHAPELDELIVVSMIEFVSNGYIKTYHPPHDMWESLQDIRTTMMATKTKKVVVMDTSVLECMADPEDVMHTLQGGDASTMFVIPLVAFRELALTLRTMSATDRREYREMITNALVCIVGLMMEGKNVRLLHATEELLLKAHAKHLKLEQALESFQDDNDRTLFVVRCLRRLLFSDIEEGIEVVLATADEELVQIADGMIPTVVLAGPQEGVLPSNLTTTTTTTTTTNDDHTPPRVDPAIWSNPEMQIPQQLVDNSGSGDVNGAYVVDELLKLDSRRPREHSSNTNNSQYIAPPPDANDTEGLHAQQKKRQRRNIHPSLRKDLRQYHAMKSEKALRTKARIALPRQAKKPFWNLPIMKVNINDPRNKEYLVNYSQLLENKRLKVPQK
eukprot:PhF_6_TR26070/c0_g1_i1/m.36766